MAVHSDCERILSLCSGVGMLDEGVRAGLAFLGRASRVVGYCERDAFAASCLLARMEESSLEPAPVSDDLADFDRRWRGSVDWIVAGFPCQPWSHAGKQAGTSDERWLWPALYRVGLDVRPRYWLLENVPGLLSGGGLAPVLADLAAGGWDAEWIHLSAASVGASHLRERVFILAYDPQPRSGRVARKRRSHVSDARRSDPVVADSEHGTRSAKRGIEPRQWGISQAGLEPVPGGIGESLEYARGQRRQAGNEPLQRSGIEPGAGLPDDAGERRLAVDDAECNGGRIGESGRGQNRRPAAGGTSGDVGDADALGRWGQGDRGLENRADPSSGAVGDAGLAGLSLSQCDELPGAERIDEGGATGQPGRAPLFAPGPKADWRAITEMLYPAVEPGFRLLVDGDALVLDAARADQLRCAGNSVVALCAGAALVELVRRAGIFTA